MSCLIVTPEIRDLTEKLQGETEQSVLGLVALWQEQNNRSIEEYPTKEELIDFRDTIRKTEAEKMLDEGLSPTPEESGITSLEEQAKVDLDFDPQTRRDRVTLIAKLFNNEVDKAVQELNGALNERLNTASESEKQQLQKDIHNLNRIAAIKAYTPGGLFNRVKSIFQDYVNDTEENRVKVELDKINATPGAERYTDEQKLEAAKKRALYKEQAYRKVVDNFKPLAEEASSLLVLSEGVKVDLNYVAPTEVNLSEDSIDGEGILETLADEYSREESVKDGWMSNVREVSSHESLSQAVRKAINQVPKLDYRGKFEKDDLGFPRYLDANYVHATLIDKLKDMITAEDMIPMLQELEKTKPWVKQVTKLLQKDETLFSQFYQDFRKDFVPYWVQKKVMSPNGTFRMQTVAINKPEGIYYLLDSWRDNYESGNLLDEDSVYDKNGSINVANAEKGLKWVEALNNKFINLDTNARLELLEQDRIWNTVQKLLKMVGIDANPSILRTALTDIKTSDTIKYTDPIMLLLPQLNIIFNGIKKGEIKSEVDENGVEKHGDLINTFGSAYNAIANMLANVTEDAIESSVSQSLDGKTKSYYSHVVPNYLGKLMKKFKNASRNPARFNEFINTEFKQFEWFFKDGRWRSDWLEQLVNSEEMRQGFNHKVVLSSDRVGYTNWDPIDYTIALLTEYWGTPEDSRSGTKWAWYHVPILSDSPSAEFIRFRKYTSGIEYDEEGNKLTYEDIILDKLTDLVNQEYDRIMLVRERADRYQNGESIDLIDNFDMQDDKVGGAEFKFLPALNSLTFEGGETFLQRLGSIRENGTGAELKKFIRDSLKEVMDNSFEEAYQNWARIGLFEEIDGKYKYLPNNMFKVGQIQQNSKTVKSLIKAKEILGSLWSSEMENLLGDYNNNNPIDNRVANRILSQIREFISQRATRNSITQQEASNINKELVVKNNAKDALREYFWNSTLATSQIIELTTSDLAFYKNLEDFQKRFKEIHAPSNRLNMLATYKGEKIGREFERTIYLQDDIIASSGINEIEEILNGRVERGEMTQSDKDSIIRKFKEVNVADAQAYRSLSSYRAILGMMGQWTDDMEAAYNHFKEGTWDINDFNIIWQTKKPYLYTQINNESGVPGHTGIKTPVQHKNSEFLLLAMYDLVAGPLGKSGKLKAINKFMEENNIDVVQFESTTKVGGQGKININDVNTEAEVIQRLKDATGIGANSENPNVVHKVSYEDYGIQTPIPEHIIDTKQGIGTQSRKLIMADIAKGAELYVDGKKMPKEEWVKLYNAVNTENVLQSFKEVREIFQDPKQLEKVLLDEMRGNPRYSADMVKACTLNEDGQFNIPLFDPIQSKQLQTLLNSIIKSRITKQKTRGGALTQVTSYGLTNDLHIIYEGAGDTKRIKYMECYMPAYSREFYEPLMDPETHQLDINKLPEDLRRLVGYRIPTEDKYSMAPLRIKGFLPQQNGSAIMLPAEITTLSGSDK